MKIKSVILWTVGGALFGIFIGAFAAFFENGPSIIEGIQQSWWWFAIAGFLKGATDPKDKRTP